MSWLNHIFVLLFSFLELSFESNLSEDHQTSNDFMLCRYCGYNIAPASLVINVESPFAESVSNYSLFGLKDIGVQTLKNPHGIEFSTVTTKGGTCLGYSSHWQTDDSWFPGYAWKACKCYRCQKHLGWVFEPLATASSDRVYASLKGFYVLNLDSIISEAYADSLIASPKIL